MKGKARTSAMPWLFPLLLLGGALHAAAAPRGRVIGPAALAQSGAGGQGGAGAAPSLMAARAAAGCTVYFDATGQLNFNPPANNTPLFPGIRPTDVVAGGPSVAHGTRGVQARWSGPQSLAGDAAIDGMALAPVEPAIPQQAVQGVAYFATSTTCTGASDFTTVVQSKPAGINAPPPTGTVIAQLNSRLRIVASYRTYYAKDPATYLCSGVSRGYVLCNVWRVDVSFNFLTSSFDADGAGNYSLTINQISMTSP